MAFADTTEAPIELNVGLDVAAAADAFGRRGRVRIPDVLAPSSAARLYECLAREVPWRLTYNDGAKNVIVDEAEFWNMDAAAQRDFMQGVMSRAQHQFQYLYQTYPMITAYLEGDDAGLFLHRVLEWLNTAETLEALRRITGIDSLYKANAQATLYRPGNFLKLHDDSGYPQEHRRVAYVLNMTREWRPDWGGQLQFVTAHGDIEEAWMPCFNSLALFLVPTWHTVSYVSPFAGQPRYAITGWLCDR